MNTRLVLLGWLVMLGSLWLFAPRRDAEGSQSEERVVLLDVGDEGGLQVRVDGAKGLRIVAHLEVPAEQATDGRRQWVFGVALQLEGGRRGTRRWDHHLRSRVLLDDEARPLVRTPRPGRRVTDGRVIDLDPGFAPEGGVLRIEPGWLPEGTRLLLRLFEVEPGEEPTALLARSWPQPYPPLTTEEYVWFSRWRRQSRSPELFDGETIAVLRRPAEVEGEPYEPLRTLEPGQATAYNVRGPATLEVRARAVATGTAVADALRVERVSVDGVRRVAGEIEVAADEVVSLRVFNDSTVTLRPEVRAVDGLPVARWGEPAPSGDGRLRPEERRVRLLRVGPDTGPLRIPVDAGNDTGVLRVDARPVRAGELAKVQWTAFDADGRALASGGLDAPFVAAPFERYADPLDGEASEPVSRFVVHPGDARTVEWTADQPVDLRLLVPLPGHGVKPPGYEVDESLSSRFVPWLSAPWVSLTPVDVAALVREERVKTLVSTVRIEPRGAGDDEDVARSTDTVLPRYAPPRFPVLEPTDSTGPFERWHRSRLGERQTLEIPASGHVVLEHRLPRSAVGGSAELRCGNIAVRQPIRTTRGTLHFHDLPPGRRLCTLDAPSGVWFARVAGGARWAHRTLFRVDDRGVSVRIPRLEGAESLYVRAYTPVGHPPPTLLAEVDGGVRTERGATVEHPTRMARHFVPEEASGEGLLDSGGAVTRWTGMHLLLGDDLEEGEEHTVELRATSPVGGPVYVRFDATWESGGRQRTLHWPEASE